MDLLTISGALIILLAGVISAFFWRKIDEMSSKIQTNEKDIDMAHRKIVALQSEAATKVQLNETVEKVRADIKGEFDRQEIRQEKREAHLKETLDKMYDMLMDMAKRIKN